MLKTLYDADCLTFSPQGKLFQVDYSLEAVKLGSICIGLKSKDFVILGSLKRAPTKLACYQEKIFQIDDKIGIAISGLTADASPIVKKESFVST